MNDSEISLKHIEQIANELKVKALQVAATAKLLLEGATVPFISRYRKEVTGSLDEVQVAAVRDRMEALKALDDRRAAILKSLAERQLLTDLLKRKIEVAETLNVLEDIFAPFRPKRRTKATIAKEKGLEPLADWIEANALNSQADLKHEVSQYIDASKEVADSSAALAGARDIIAERFSDQAEVRAALRKLYTETATITSKLMIGKEKEEEAQKFRDYYDWSEPLRQIPSHRLLAIRRGEKEGFLLMRIQPSEDAAIKLMESILVKGKEECAAQLSLAASDSYKRLLSSSMETEFRLESKKKADEDAVRVFAENLRELLLAAPLGQKRVLGIDPGFRTGCKLVVLDAQGQLLYNDVMYLLGDALMKAKTMLIELVTRYKIEVIAIGNGTASRETEQFVQKIGLPKSLLILMVNESGASIYSASDVAREEFPNHDITVRGAVSIARRLMDPLAELVKIDPKSIGVGQYQHDVDQNKLKASLDDVVVSAVNAVGVELNTASKQLLSYVSGLNATHAANIVAYRNEFGPFKTRQELLKVPGLGEKAFEQAAGFLRIRNGDHPLDASAVHPERYHLVESMAKDIQAGIQQLLEDAKIREKIELKKYISEDVGQPTLNDIMQELAKPGRDPRKQYEVFKFSEGVNELKDLQVGMKLPGIVTNVTAFGAFVDIGVHQDGLVHISQIADHFIQDPSSIVKVQQKVMVTVTEVDAARKRIALSMKSKPDFEKNGNSQTNGGGTRSPQNNQSRGGSTGGSASGLGGGDWFSAAMNKGKK
jgi:uncharacterized protein